MRKSKRKKRDEAVHKKELLLREKFNEEKNSRMFNICNLEDKNLAMMLIFVTVAAVNIPTKNIGSFANIEKIKNQATFR